MLLAVIYFSIHLFTVDSKLYICLVSYNAIASVIITTVPSLLGRV